MKQKGICTGRGHQGGDLLESEIFRIGGKTQKEWLMRGTVIGGRGFVKALIQIHRQTLKYSEGGRVKERKKLVLAE